MKTFQISQLLDFWHFVSLFWFPQYFAQMAPTLFSVLLSDLFCSLLCPLHEDTSFPWLCRQGSIGQSCLCLCTCLLPFAPQCKNLLTTFLLLTAVRLLGNAAETSVLLAWASSLAEVSPVPDKSALSTFFSARY